MKKINKRLIEIWMFLVSMLIALAIGGTFIDGGYMTTTILNIFPLVIHQLVGWTIIISVALVFIYRLVK